MTKPNVTDTLSLVVITKNEEHNIGCCLKSWENLGPIIVVDDYSSDKTIEIARQYRAIVVQRKFDNFSAQKQFAVSNAPTNWVLVIDADERISPQLKASLLDVDFTNLTTAYTIRRENYFLGKRIRFSGWNPDLVTRLFNKNICQFNGDLVHESITGFETLSPIRGNLIHFSYVIPKDVEMKIEKYSHLGAENLAKRNKKYPSEIRVFGSSLWAFLRTFLFRLGIFDGASGWQVALMNAKTTFRKYKKYQSRFPRDA